MTTSSLPGEVHNTDSVVVLNSSALKTKAAVKAYDQKPPISFDLNENVLIIWGGLIYKAQIEDINWCTEDKCWHYGVHYPGYSRK